MSDWRENEPRFLIPGPETGFGIEDLYKLVHQAFQGPGHAIPTREAAAASLAREWSGLGPGRPDERMIEVLVREAPFVRVHLRPFRDRGGRMEDVLAAFLRSARVAPDPASFRRVWAELGEWLAGGGSHLNAAAHRDLDARARDLGYPAIHHSQTYLRATDPAYRVVARGEAPDWGGTGPGGSG